MSSSYTETNVLKVKGVFGAKVDLAISSLFINTLAFALPITMMQIYDRILVYNATETLLWLLIGTSTALLFDSILRFARGYMSGWMAARFEYLVGQRLFEHILNGYVENFTQNSPAIHQDRLSSVSQLASVYAGQAYQVALDFPFIALFLFAIWFLSPPISYFILTLIILYILISAFFRRKFYKYRKLQNEEYNLKRYFIVDKLTRIHSLKAYALEEQILRKFEEIQAKTSSHDLKIHFWSMVPENLGAFFGQIVMFGTIGLGATFVMQEKITIGTLTACMILGQRAMQPVQSIISFWLKLAETSIAKQKIKMIMEMPRKETDTLEDFPEHLTGHITVSKLTLRDIDGSHLLKDIDLFINAKKMIGIIPSDIPASGKLFRCMAGLHTPDSGKVVYDHFNLANKDIKTAKGLVEYVGETGLMFKGTVLENIALFDHSQKDVAMDLASLVGLNSYVAELPFGFDSQLNSQSNNLLQLGFIQRIHLARALLRRPPILIFDRTTSFMDNKTLSAFAELLQRLKGQLTIVLATNELNILNMCHKVYDLDDAKLTEVRNPSEFLRKKR